MRPSDAAALIEHLRALLEEDAFFQVASLAESDVSPERVRAVIGALDASDRGLLVAARAPPGARDAAVVGAVTVRPGRLARTRHVGEVTLGVRRGWRRQGVGSALLEAALDAAACMPGLRRLALEVVAANEPALRLYAAHGFVEEGRRRGHVHWRGRDVDLVLMGRGVGTEPRHPER